MTLKRSPMPPRTMPMQRAGMKSVDCWCETCRPNTMTSMRMITCQICGNKRCPHATDHMNECTGSNEAGQPGSSWEHVKPAEPRKPMKKVKVKMTEARKAARGQNCTLMFPGCPNATETTVLCHLRMYGGGGMGLKPDDAEAIFADMHCHDLLDSRAKLSLPEGESIHEYIARALIRTLRIQRESGVLTFKGE